MPQRKVFISYSVKGCENVCSRRPECDGGTPNCRRSQESQAFLNRLVAELERLDMEPLYDRNQLFAGQDWRQKLYPALAGCEASIILLSESAMDSIYVPLEAMVLTWRRLLDPAFEVIPIFFPAVDEKMLRDPQSRFFGVGLENIQALKVQVAAEEQALDALVNRVRASAPTLAIKELGALRRLAELIKGVDEEQMEAACSKLPGGALRWDPLLPKALQMAGLLMQRPLREILNCLTYLCTSMDPQKRGDVLTVLAPRWVNGVASEPLWRMSTSAAGPRIHMLNACDFKTAQHYVWRAWSHEWRIDWTVLNGNSLVATPSGEEQKTNVLREIAVHLMPGEYEDMEWDDRSANEVVQILQERAEDHQPVYIVFLEAPGVSLDIARELQNGLPGLTVVYLAQEVAAAAAHGVQVLNPPLQPGEEERALRVIKRAKSLLFPETQKI